MGFVLNAVLQRHGLMLAATGLICSLVIYVPLYLVRGMGAGDVKLMAAVGAIAGPANWVGIFLATAIIGGMASVALIAWRRRFGQTVNNLCVIAGELLHWRAPANKDPRLDVRDGRALRMPHGAFIASGAMLFLLVLRQSCDFPSNALHMLPALAVFCPAS